MNEYVCNIRRIHCNNREQSLTFHLDSGGGGRTSSRSHGAAHRLDTHASQGGAGRHVVSRSANGKSRQKGCRELHGDLYVCMFLFHERMKITACTNPEKVPRCVALVARGVARRDGRFRHGKRASRITAHKPVLYCLSTFDCTVDRIPSQSTTHVTRRRRRSFQNVLSDRPSVQVVPVLGQNVWIQNSHVTSLNIQSLV